jgi:hypothetical protein
MRLVRELGSERQVRRKMVQGENAPENDSGYECAGKRERQNHAKVTEEVLLRGVRACVRSAVPRVSPRKAHLLQLIPRVENDRWEEDVEENGAFE